MVLVTLILEWAATQYWYILYFGHGETVQKKTLPLNNSEREGCWPALILTVLTVFIFVHPCACVILPNTTKLPREQTYQTMSPTALGPYQGKGYHCFHNCQASHVLETSYYYISLPQRLWVTQEKRHRDRDRRGLKRALPPTPPQWKEEKKKTKSGKHISCVLHRNERKFLLLQAAFGMSESCFVHAPWQCTAHWFHSNNWPFCEFQRTIHCPWDHLQLACMWHHSKLHQLSISIKFLYIKVIGYCNIFEHIKSVSFIITVSVHFLCVEVIFYLKGLKTEKKQDVSQN